MGKGKRRDRATDARAAVRDAAPHIPMASGGSTFHGDASLRVGSTWPRIVYTASPGTYAAVDEAAVWGAPAVFACIRLIAGVIAGQPWHEWRGPVRLPLSRLARRPAAGMTRRAWTARVIASLMLYQRAPLLMAGGVDHEGVPGSLLPIPPTVIRPAGAVDPLGMVPPTRYNIAGREVSAEEVIMLELLPMPTPLPWLRGSLDLARSMYGAVLAADEHARSWWADARSPAVVLTSDQELTEPQAEAISTRWMTRRAAGGHGAPAVLGKGAHAEVFGADPTREAAVAARREMRAEVASYFGVPPYLVNAPLAGGTSLTYTTTESQALDLIRYCLRTYSDPIEDAVSELLPGDYQEGRRINVDYTLLTAGELAARFGAYATATGGKPWMTGAEVRAIENMDPDAPIAGDQPLPWDVPAPVPPPAIVDPAPGDSSPGAGESPEDDPQAGEREEVGADA